MVPQGPTRGNDRLPHSVAVASGRARATTLAAIAAPLTALLAHDVATWDTHGLERIKERTVRSVFRGALAGVPVHVKVFRADTLADRARDALRRPRGGHEAANLLRAAGLGLPVAEPLAYGAAEDGGQLRSFVVTRTIDGAAPFSFACDEATRRRVGALLRSIHDAGVEPGDLHTGNLLLDGDRAPWLVDLTAVRFAGPPSLPRRAAALATFCQDLDGGSLDPGATALLAGYLAAGPLPPSFRRELELATHRWRARALRAFGRRATRSCRHTFVPERRRAEPRWHWHLANGGEDETVRERCRALQRDPGQPLRRGRRGAVWLHGDLAVKERDAGAARDLWHANYLLSFARVPIAPPVALCLHGGVGHVFCRRLAAPTLAAEVAAGRIDARAATVAAASLGNSVGRLHAHGLRNRDLKFDNLVRDPASGIVHIVDLDGVRLGAATDTRGAGADIGRLLAAFLAAGSPGGIATQRAFVRAYVRANRRLRRRPPLRRILRRAEQRAGEWASAHH